MLQMTSKSKVKFGDVLITWVSPGKLRQVDQEIFLPKVRRLIYFGKIILNDEKVKEMTILEKHS